MRQIKPIPTKNRYFKDVEKELREFFFEKIYSPLLDLIQGEFPFLNAKHSPLSQAIQKNRVVYEAGEFTGSFSAAVSKELKGLGAKFDRRSKTWKLSESALPVEIQSAIAISKQRIDAVYLKAMATIESIDPKQLVKGFLPKSFNRLPELIEEDFQKAADAVSVLPKLTEEGRQRMLDEFRENMELRIQGWTDLEVKRLRKRVEQDILKGYRAKKLEPLVSNIAKSKGITDRHAAFIARQETSLFKSKYLRTRAKDTGATKYRWSTSKDERVRTDHEHLDGLVFGINDAPVVDTKTGRRAFPGEDYNCRCVAVYFVE